jgi:predicted secreted protein
MDVRDITTKDSGGRREVAAGKIQWSINFEGLVTYATASDIDTPNAIYDLADGKTSVTLKYGSLSTGEYDYSGAGYFSSYSQEAGVEDNNTFSASFEGTGALTQAAVS